MFQFFGILKPDFHRLGRKSEAPYKTAFFGGQVPSRKSPEPLTRIERDAILMAGAWPGPERAEESETEMLARLFGRRGPS
jgi:hypothetical protein